MKKRRLHTMSPACTALALAAGTLLAGGVTLALQQGSLLATLSAFWAEPILFVLNLWPVAALALLFYFLLGNAWYGAGLTTLIWGLLSYINLVKVDARGDPFVPGDILLLTEGMEAVGNYQLNMHWGKLALLLGLSLALILLGTGVKSARPRLVIRLVAALTVVAAFGTTMAFLYPDSELYDRMEGPNRANVPAVYEAFGFPYCFLHNFNLYPVDKPPGYNAQEAASYEDTYREAEAAPETAPNILMVMCEAFTDLPNQAAFTYTGETNPIAAYNRLAEQTLSGHLVVSNTGAGTANTEFDVLTGMMTNRIGTGTTSAFRVVHRNIDSIPRMLTQAGYRTFFPASGQNWFYNRESVYSYLGITDQVFQDAFSRSDLVGDWISDAGFLRVLKSPWKRGRGYAAVYLRRHHPKSPILRRRKIRLCTGPASNRHRPQRRGPHLLIRVFQRPAGQRRHAGRADRISGQPGRSLTFWYFSETISPTWAVIIWPTELDPNYGSTDTVEETLQPYTVPYLIWGNAAYRQDHDLLAQAQAWNLPETISSHYLGALTCQLAGYQGHDGYFDFLNALREQLPVSSVYGYQLSDGSYTDTLPDDLQALEDIRWKWQYYRLMEQPLS